jgi:hypothetical protein
LLGLGVVALLAFEYYSNRQTHHAAYAFQGRGFNRGGSSGAPAASVVTGGFQASPDVQTANCTPAPAGGMCGGSAMYCNPPGVECGCGSDCADARVQYCQTYGVGGECLSGPGGFSGPPAADQGLPGQGPIVGSGAGDIMNTYGYASPQYAAASQTPGVAAGFSYPTQPYNQSPYGYGAPPQQQYGYPQQQMPYGYGMPPQQYGYPPQMPYGYGYGSMPPTSPYGYGYGMPPSSQMPYGYGSSMPYGYGMMPPPSPYGYSSMPPPMPYY